MPSLLKNLKLEELSLVDRPANAQAMVSLFKRDSKEEVTKMTDEMDAKVKAYMKEKGCGKPEAMKALGYDMTKADEASDEASDQVDQDVDKADAEQEAPTEVETLKADVDRLQAENDQLRQDLAKSVEKADDSIDVDGVMVSKADIPAPVLKALETAKLEKADYELTKRAEETLPHFDVNVAKSLVKSFADNEVVMAALLAADKSFEAAMQEFGKSDAGNEFASASDKLDALVKNYMNENGLKKSDYAKAYAVIAKTEEGKTLINKSYKGE